MAKLVNNIVRIPSKLDSDFYKLWFDFIQPLHKLAKKECEVMACYVEKYCELKTKVSDDDLIAQFLKTEDVKKDICNRCSIKLSHLNVILTKFRQKGIIYDGRIHPKYIPNVTDKDGSFGLLIYFDFSKNEDKGNNSESSETTEP